MTELNEIAQHATDIPLLVGGLRAHGRTVHMPHRYGRHLAAWAAEQGITEYADVAATALIGHGRIGRGPLQRLSAAERRMIDRDERVIGWSLEIITEREIVELDLYETGEIVNVRRRPLDDARAGERVAVSSTPIDIVRAAASLEASRRRQHEQARIARDVAIRAALNEGMSVRTIAEASGLHEQRIYQIRDGRR